MNLDKAVQSQIFLLLLSVLFLFSSCVRHKGFALHNPENVFDEIPIDRQSLLEKRLEQFLEFHVNHQWDDVYRYINQNYFRSIQEISPEEFIQDYQDWLFSGGFVKFKAYSCQPLYLFTSNGSGYVEGTWIVTGCGTYQRGPTISRYETQIEASWEKENWYFSPPSLCFRGTDMPPEKCQY